MILTTNHILELINVTHTGQVEEGSCLQTIFGSVPTGVILKDVCLEVRGGEVMAILGSKGSGKQALLEVLSGRALGPTKGQIILNGVSLSLKLFQQCCAFVSQRVDLLPGLTVKQTLTYVALATIGSKVSAGMKRTRVKQVMADMALHQVASRDVSLLTTSEYRRLTIGIQLIRDPVVLLLDEPTADLDPLNTYFIVSILSNHAKKYSRIVILTMEKPRSDIFPFLDRVSYLCMGDIVYTGSSRMMMDYFRNIGFPSPELENPLMYYLCLSTVDRRSRERLIDSTNQIGALIEKFRLEGAPFRKSISPTLEMNALNPYSKVSLTVYGSASGWSVFWILIRRMWRIPLNGISKFNPHGLRHVFLRLLLLPVVFTFLFMFCFRMSDFQRSFITRNGLLFSCLAITAYLSTAITAATFATHRTRYYQERREAMYSGPLFVLCHTFYGLPISAISMFIASTVIYWSTGMHPEAWRWLAFSGVLWAVYLFVELQTMALMAIVKSSYAATNASIFLNTLYLVTASGNLRSLLLLPEWLYYLSFATIFRYAGAFLNENEFMDNLAAIPSNGNDACLAPNAAQGCVYVNGTHFLSQRYHMKRSERYANDLEMTRNLTLCFAFSAAMLVIDLLLYLAPLPAFLKSKFRK